MEKITEIFVVLENKPSTLGDLCSCLSENKINIEAIGLFQDSAKLYVKNINKAMKILAKYKYETETRDVLRVDLEHRPGALADVAALGLVKAVKDGHKSVDADSAERLGQFGSEAWTQSHLQ